MHYRFSRPIFLRVNYNMDIHLGRVSYPSNLAIGGEAEIACFFKYPDIE